MMEIDHCQNANWRFGGCNVREQRIRQAERVELVSTRQLRA